MKNVYFILLISFITFCSSFTLGDEGAKPKTSGHGEGGEKSPEEKAAAAAKLAKKYERTNKYVHEWISSPTFTLISLKDSKSLIIKPKKGEISVLIFMASWCVACQQLIESFQALEKKFPYFTNFYYVFSHDTKNDASRFAASFLDRSYLADDSMLKAFHNPELPSIYIVDRDGFMVDRKLKITKDDLKDFELLLAGLCSI